MAPIESISAGIISDLANALFDQPVMSNLARPLYVERLVLAALGPSWTHVGADWAGWDLEDVRGTRIEVKQSAARQTWTDGPTSLGSPTRPVFDIASRTGYYTDGGSRWAAGVARPADLYVFAWHPVFDVQLVDHRDPRQWQFFVVLESNLPLQKTLGLKSLQALARLSAYAELAEKVASLLRPDVKLKASICPGPQIC
jgi:hypothetical protein